MGQFNDNSSSYVANCIYFFKINVAKYNWVAIKKYIPHTSFVLVITDTSIILFYIWDHVIMQLLSNPVSAPILQSYLKQLCWKSSTLSLSLKLDGSSFPFILAKVSRICEPSSKRPLASNHLGDSGRNLQLY